LLGQESSIVDLSSFTYIIVFEHPLWLFVFVGGAALDWWFMYGPWRNIEGPDPLSTFLAHDAVRFGAVPMCFSGLWLLLVIITLIVTRELYFRKIFGTRGRPK
jgi:hypothetical protein